MKKLEITNGDWIISDEKTNGIFIKPLDNSIGALARIYTENGLIQGKSEYLANAQLIADAGTTYNKLHILPSQLANDRERLIDFIEGVIESDCLNPYICQTAQELLTSLNQ